MEVTASGTWPGSNTAMQPRFRIEDGRLVETFRGARYLQHRWEDGFARVLLPDSPYGVARGSAGIWDVLDPAGDPRPGLGVLEPFLAGIPRPYRRLAGRLPRCQWLALEAMRHVPGFALFLHQERTGCGLGFVLAAWQLALADLLPFHDRLALARAMMHEPRGALLTRLLDAPVHDRHVRAICRVPVAELSDRAILDIIGLMGPEADPALFQRAPTIPAQAVRLLRQLPRWMLHPAVAAALCANPCEEKRLAEVLTPRVVNAPLAERPRILRILRTATSGAEFCRRLLRANWKLREAEPFPPPPMPGTEALQPIRTPGELAREGRRLRHCVADHEEDVWDGGSYFYRWLGRERATVELQRDGDGFWRLCDAVSYDDAGVGPDTFEAIRDIVAEQLPQPPFRLYTYVAGVAYYQAMTLKDRLRPGDPLLLRREPDNPYDGNAIVVLDARGRKLGYVPRVDNEVPARLMDAGNPLAATIYSWDGTLYGLCISVREERDGARPGSGAGSLTPSASSPGSR